MTTWTFPEPGSWESATQVIRSIRRHEEVTSAVRNDVDIAAAMTQAKTNAVGLATNPDAPNDLRVSVLRFTAVAGIPNSDAAGQLVERAPQVEVWLDAATAHDARRFTLRAVAFARWRAAAWRGDEEAAELWRQRYVTLARMSRRPDVADLLQTLRI